MKIALAEDGTQVGVNEAKKSGRYFCPFCYRRMVLCIGIYKNKYFAHKSIPKTTKSEGGETKRHLKGKAKIIDIFSIKATQVESEVYFPEIRQRADIIVEINERRYVIEYQCSPIQLNEIRRRKRAYQQIGLISIWIAGPQHLTEKRLLQTIQKFGSYSIKNGWHLWTWDAQVQAKPYLLTEMQRQALGKIIFKDQNSNINWSLPSLEYEVHQIEHFVLGNKIDQRYLKVQQLCYENGKTLLGCPWLVHFPRVCTDFKNINLPILNRIEFLISAEEKIQVTEMDQKRIDLEFWNFLVREQILYRHTDYWRINLHKIIWYSDSEEKLRALKKTKNKINLLWS